MHIGTYLGKSIYIHTGNLVDVAKYVGSSQAARAANPIPGGLRTVRRVAEHWQ